MVANPRLRAQSGKRNDSGAPGADLSSSFALWPKTAMRRSQAEDGRPADGSMFALNALDEDCSIKNEAPDLLQIIIGNWNNLSQSEREKCVQIAARSNEVPRAPVDANAAGSSQSSIDLNPRGKLKGKGKSKQKPSLPPKGGSRKRKARTEEETDEDEWQESMKPQELPRISFCVQESDKVEAFLYTRFMQIQQSAGKVIAKAWIKAICPKKQANYPYVDCNPRPDQPRRRPRHPGPPRVPMFWPDLALCRHKEPDHLDKNERTYLLVHLLHIFWGPEQWKQSNGESCEVPKFIMSNDWVHFLRDAFPPEKLAEVPGCTAEKTALRMKYLDDIYKVVLTEQEYLQGGNDGKTVFTFTGGMKMMHPRDARPRRTRPNNQEAGEDQQQNEMQRSATPISAAQTVTATTSPLDTPTDLPTGSGGDGAEGMTSKHRRPSEKGVERRPLVNTKNMQMSETIPSSPWEMIGRSNHAPGLNPGLTNPAAMTVCSGSGADPMPETQLSPHQYLGFVPQYGSSQGQVTLSGSPAWGECFPPYVGFTPPTLSKEPLALGGGMGGMSREDLGALDPMLGSLSLRSQGAETSLYGPDQKLYESAPGRMHPVTYTTDPGQPQVSGEGLMDGTDQRREQCFYVSQPMSNLGHGLPHEMDFASQMMPFDGGYQHNQSSMIPQYQHF